jgi:hypothetical protein
MFAPSALWIGAALARAASFLPEDAAERSQFQQWLADTDSVTRQFRNANGQWHFAAGDGSNDSANTYSAILALLYLVERAQLTDGGAARARNDAKSTFTTLVATHVRDRNHGWQSFPGRGLVMRALSLQVYATMLRASTELGFEMPDDLVRDAAHAVLAFEGQLPTETYQNECVVQEIDEYGGNYTDEKGQKHEEEFPVSYIWYPWVMDAGFRLVSDDRFASRLSRVQRRRLQRQLAIWVEEPKVHGLKWATDMSGGGTWALAETYIGLSRCASRKLLPTVNAAVITPAP